MGVFETQGTVEGAQLGHAIETVMQKIGKQANIKLMVVQLFNWSILK